MALREGFSSGTRHCDAGCDTGLIAVDAAFQFAKSGKTFVNMLQKSLGVVQPKEFLHRGDFVQDCFGPCSFLPYGQDAVAPSKCRLLALFPEFLADLFALSQAGELDADIRSRLQPGEEE